MAMPTKKSASRDKEAPEKHGERPLALEIKEARGLFKEIDTDVERERRDRLRFEAVLAKVPDAPPIPGDELE